jgi:hypothetical protein
VELAGPAGAGKSATRRALIARSRAETGEIWGLPVPLLLLNGLELIPSFVPMWLAARAPLWDETRHMVRLQTLERVLRDSGRPRSTMIFDEGPIFALAWLRGFGHSIMRSDELDDWWSTTLQQWALIVPVIIVLDAPDEVLIRRIRTRPEDHEVKNLSAREIAAWMARFRQALDWVLTSLAIENGVTVIRLDTSASTPEQLADRAMATLGGGVCAG